MIRYIGLGRDDKVMYVEDEGCGCCKETYYLPRNIARELQDSAEKLKESLDMLGIDYDFVLNRSVQEVAEAIEPHLSEDKPMYGGDQ